MAQDPSDLNAAPTGVDPALGSLDQRLDAARRAEDQRLARVHAPMRDSERSVGMQIASTMVGYPLGGLIIGWGLDGLFGTRPWIMIALMFMAFAGALIQVIRSNKLRQD